MLEGHVFHRILGWRPLPHPKMNQLRVMYPLIFWTGRKHVLIVALRKPRCVMWASWPLAFQSAFPACSLPGSSRGSKSRSRSPLVPALAAVSISD